LHALSSVRYFRCPEKTHTTKRSFRNERDFGFRLDNEKMNRRTITNNCIPVFLVFLLQSVTAQTKDWPWWRGPHSNGVAASGQSLPTTWNPSAAVWKTHVPGRGSSSPIVVGQRVILSTADEKLQVQSVVCYDRKTGKQLWKTDVNKGGFNPRIHTKNTHATPTVASNGTHVFAVFNNHGNVQVTALTLDGEKAWQEVAGPFQPKQYQFGYAPSPVLYKSTVIVVSDYENNGYLAALDQKTGKQVWQTARPGTVSYSSPIVGRVAGKDQLLLSGCYQVISYDPNTGKQLWSMRGVANATCGTMVWSDDMVFASGGYPQRATVGIKADGSGKVVWQNTQKAYEQSMLVHNGHLYTVTDRGIAFCWDAKTGTEKWKGRLGGKVSSSPTLTGGNIYVSNERGTTFVFRPGPQKFELVTKFQLGDEAMATPAFCGNQVFVRAVSRANGSRQETLYCFAK
jgi:hypothetical protein